MAETVQTIETFDSLIKRHKLPLQRPPEEVLAAIEQVRTATPEVYNPKRLSSFIEERTKVLSLLVDDYLKATLGQKYPVVDPAIWKLERFLHGHFVNNNPVIISDRTESSPPSEADHWSIRTKLLAYVDLNGNHACDLGTYEIPHGTNKYKLTLAANLPGTLGTNLRNAYRTAVRDAHAAISELLSTGGVGDVLTETFEPVSVKVIVTWIPTVESLKLKHELIQPVKNDPAMLLGLRNHWFLVALWAVDDEVPLERFMREYTTGNFANVTKGNE